MKIALDFGAIRIELKSDSLEIMNLIRQGDILTHDIELLLKILDTLFALDLLLVCFYITFDTMSQVVEEGYSH